MLIHQQELKYLAFIAKGMCRLQKNLFPQNAEYKNRRQTSDIVSLHIFNAFRKLSNFFLNYHAGFMFSSDEELLKINTKKSAP